MLPNGARESISAHSPAQHTCSWTPPMGRKGQLDLVVRAGGVSAPAQHITNASDLRASLLGFFFAFWEYVMKERGGLKTLILDDPQELLDSENLRRVADSFGALVDFGAQLGVA